MRIASRKHYKNSLSSKKAVSNTEYDQIPDNAIKTGLWRLINLPFYLTNKFCFANVNPLYTLWTALSTKESFSYQAVQPPSITRLDPVIYFEAFDARKMRAPLYSSAWAIRPIGIRLQ